MRWGGGRFKPSFYRSSFHSAFLAFACLPCQRHRQAQSFLFLVARSFLSIFQRTANANLYRGASSSFTIFCFKRDTCPYAPVCLLRAVRRQACGHAQAGGKASVRKFQLATTIAQCVTWVFYMCVWLLCMHKTSDFKDIYTSKLSA